MRQLFIKKKRNTNSPTFNFNNKDLDSVIPTEIIKTGGLPKVLNIFVRAIVKVKD